MSLQVEKLEKNMAKLTIEVSAEELEKAIESVYQRSKKNISVPGFRKGKSAAQDDRENVWQGSILRRRSK